MTRVKRGISARKRHKNILSQTKGFWGQRSNIFKRAHETLLRAWAFAFVGRKKKKRDMRSLFITRIKAGSVANGISYSKFMFGLKKQEILLNRKMLSQLAITEPSAFSQLTLLAKNA